MSEIPKLTKVPGGRDDLARLMNEVSERLGPHRGSGGGGDGIEPRLAKLESDIGHVQRDVGELRSDMRDVRDRLARLEERVAHLPSKGFIATSLLISLAVITGLITFQSRIEKFIDPADANGSVASTSKGS